MDHTFLITEREFLENDWWFVPVSFHSQIVWFESHVNEMFLYSFLEILVQFFRDWSHPPPILLPIDTTGSCRKCLIVGQCDRMLRSIWKWKNQSESFSKDALPSIPRTNFNLHPMWFLFIFVNLDVSNTQDHSSNRKYLQLKGRVIGPYRVSTSALQQRDSCCPTCLPVIHFHASFFLQLSQLECIGMWNPSPEPASII